MSLISYIFHSHQEKSFHIIKIILIKPKLILINPADQFYLLCFPSHGLLHMRFFVSRSPRMGRAQHIQQVAGGLFHLYNYGFQGLFFSVEVYFTWVPPSSPILGVLPVLRMSSMVDILWGL